MSNYLDHLIAKSNGSLECLKPLPVYRFEETWISPSPEWYEASFDTEVADGTAPSHKTTTNTNAVSLDGNQTYSNGQEIRAVNDNLTPSPESSVTDAVASANIDLPYKPAKTTAPEYRFEDMQSEVKKQEETARDNFSGEPFYLDEQLSSPNPVFSEVPTVSNPLVSTDVTDTAKSQSQFQDVQLRPGLPRQQPAQAGDVVPTVASQVDSTQRPPTVQTKLATTLPVVPIAPSMTMHSTRSSNLLSSDILEQPVTRSQQPDDQLLAMHSTRSSSLSPLDVLEQPVTKSQQPDDQLLASSQSRLSSTATPQTQERETIISSVELEPQITQTVSYPVINKPFADKQGDAEPALSEPSNLRSRVLYPHNTPKKSTFWDTVNLSADVEPQTLDYALYGVSKEETEGEVLTSISRQGKTLPQDRGDLRQLFEQAKTVNVLSASDSSESTHVALPRISNQPVVNKLFKGESQPLPLQIDTLPVKPRAEITSSEGTSQPQPLSQAPQISVAPKVSVYQQVPLQMSKQVSVDAAPLSNVETIAESLPTANQSTNRTSKSQPVVVSQVVSHPAQASIIAPISPNSETATAALPVFKEPTLQPEHALSKPVHPLPKAKGVTHPISRLRTMFPDLVTPTAGSSAQPPEPAPVHVTIGRLEVTASSPPSAATPAKHRTQPRHPQMSLTDYLQRRSQGG